MKKTAIIISALILSGCAVGPDYKSPSTSFENKWFSSKSKQVSNAEIDVTWWKIFNDDLLNKYIEQSKLNNKDVKTALININKSRSLSQISLSSTLPEINADAGFDRSKFSNSNSSNNSGNIRNLYDVNFDASWELDIFGGNRRHLEAADARIGQAIASYDNVMLSTLSDVARNYYEARGYQKRIKILQKNVNLLKQTHSLLKKRAKLGEASEFDLVRAFGEYQATQARIPNIRAELDASIFKLSILLGLPPEALLVEMNDSKPLPIITNIIPIGMRADILRRRPDIKIAERKLAASSADIGVEIAELFPKFFITGDLGSQAKNFADLFTSSAGVWSLGSNLTWSIFNSFNTKANINIAKSDNKIALLEYEKSILEALRDVETSLTMYGREYETRDRLKKSLKSRKKAVNIAKQLLEAGETDYLTVLDSQREFINGEESLVISETNTVIKLIALYAALGGGW